ncbi:MAG: arginine--tRNA ligase, partial [Acidocella sp.]|nr:arginine--tRNA ligase [Acidocella sp.]
MTDDLYARLRDVVVQALAEAVPGLPDDLMARVELTPTRDTTHGDMASNAAMVAAKFASGDPRALAALLAGRLAGRGGIAAAAPAGPGFVNLTLDPALLRAQIPVILAAGEAYGSGEATGRVNVEYVSANPTGPLHVGHCRGAVVGDALANLLAKAGHEVTKEFYINDAGAQMVALARSVYGRYLEALDLPEHARDYAALVPGGMQYGGDYLVPVGFALAAAYEDKFVDA